MKIEIRNDRAVVSGYVNAVGRDSRPITDVRGKFVEQIEPGAFRASLERSENVDLLLNHDKSRVYASTRDGNLRLTEDNIGLRAEAVLTDAEMIRKARSGEFRGWSFGMYVGDSAMEERAEGIPRRHVKSLNMFEVSLIDKSRIPCYVGTSVECRADGEILAELRYSAENVEVVFDKSACGNDGDINHEFPEKPVEERSEPEPVDYSAVDDVISELRYGALDNVIAELRYNPYHDPSNGRFTSGGGGGGGGVLVVEKGQKGKGVYVVDSSKFDNKEAENITAAQSEEFIKNSASLNRAEGKNAAHYLESYKAGDITEGEYKELMADLPQKVTENQKFTVNDRFGSHLVSGTTFEQNGEKFGVFSTGKSNDFVVDFSNGKSSPLKTTNSNGYALFSYSGKVSETAKALKNIRRIAARAFDPIDSVIEELRYNPYHDPSNGRFTSGGGSGGGFSNRVTVYVEKGQKGNKQYIVKGNDGNYYKYDNRSDVGEDYGIEIDLKYAQEMASKFGNMKYGGTTKSRNLFEQWSNEAKALSAELEKLRAGRRGQMNMLGQLVFESSRAFDPVGSVIEELRYNPYHDPSNGRFCSGGGGGGGGVLVVEQGQKGKGYYVVDVDHDEEYEKWEKGRSKQSRYGEADNFLREKHNNMTDANNVVSAKDIEDFINYKIGTNNTYLKVNYPQSAKTYDRPAKVDFNYGNSIDIMIENSLHAKKGAEEAFQSLKAAGFKVKKTPGSYHGNSIYNIERKKGVRKSAWEKDIPESFNSTRRKAKEIDWNSYDNASRSFDPIDSVIEELRSSDPAD